MITVPVFGFVLFCFASNSPCMVKTCPRLYFMNNGQCTEVHFLYSSYFPSVSLAPEVTLEIHIGISASINDQ